MKLLLCSLANAFSVFKETLFMSPHAKSYNSDVMLVYNTILSRSLARPLV